MKSTKKNLRTLSLLALFILFTGLVSPVGAQSYSFAVPELKMQIYVQPDSSVEIVYDITFENYGSEIDIVDIGMPHDDYNILYMQASINGRTLTGIYDSEYVHPGVEVHLEDQAIQNGDTGTLHFEFTMPNMVYQDTTNKENASLQITPTWFDGDLVRGKSHIQIAIHMPPGVQPEEVLYQKEPFTSKVLYEDRVVALWDFPGTEATREHIVGISFPQRGMTNVIKMNAFQLATKWLKDNPGVRFILTGLVFVLVSILFFRFTGGTGITLYVIIFVVMLALFAAVPLLVLFSLPFAIVFLFLNERGLKKRKKTYLPPIAEVEGGGIKRGLTAPEASVLLEMPLNKILTLVIFGLLEKNILEPVQESPLKVKVKESYYAYDRPGVKGVKERRQFRTKAAQDNGTVLHHYEHGFLDILERSSEKAVQDIDFTKPMEALIKATAGKMKGFDLSDTQDYYRRIIDQAWKKASAIEEIPEREEVLDRYLPWVMMNDDYPTVMTWGGHHYWPSWVRRSHWYTPSPVGGGIGKGGKSSGRTSSGGKTSFGDVSASFAGWAENTMGTMAAAILPGSMNIPTTKGGIVDLSGIDRVTGDVFEALSEASSSGSGGGGGGSSCACACAGCACACACAGGGR
ncbi:MAG: phage holin family protein [Anaerolineae bacterium]|nr:phage holin family protein [Anaerolineae bacterium]